MKKQLRKSFVFIVTMEYQNVRASVKFSPLIIIGPGMLPGLCNDQYFLSVPTEHAVHMYILCIQFIPRSLLCENWSHSLLFMSPYLHILSASQLFRGALTWKILACVQYLQCLATVITVATCCLLLATHTRIWPEGYDGLSDLLGFGLMPESKIPYKLYYMGGSDKNFNVWCCFTKFFKGSHLIKVTQPI